MSKLLELPHEGRMIVSTDLHGNLVDFRTLRDVWEADRSTNWLMLGDIVHGPNDNAAARFPETCDYSDESAVLVDEIASLVAEYPNVNVLLGNHDWSHVGGPVTRKFWTDEAAHLESQMEPADVESMRQFFHDANLWAWAHNGLFFSHGAAAVAPEELTLLEDLRFDSRKLADRAVMNSAMCAYGQDDETMRAFLDQMGQLLDAEFSVLVHGHDRDDDGWYTDGPYQACPIIFGALEGKKAYLDIDLSRRLSHAKELEDSLHRLYPD